MAAGRYAEAVPVYAALVKAMPGNAGLRLNLGLAHRMAGQCSEAIAPFQSAVKLDPKLFPAWVSLGGCYLELGRPADAIPPLEKAVALAPAEAMPRQLLADALYAAGRLEQAVSQLRKLAEADPSNPRAWYGLAKAYEALSQRAFERLAKTGAGSAWALALEGDVRLAGQQYGKAFALFRDALAKKPDLRGANTAVAEIYRKTGHAEWAAAAEERERAIPLPNCTVARQECAFRAGRYLDALGAAQPARPETYYWQARAYDALGTEASARLAGLPPSLELYTLKADAANARGSYVEAANELRSAMRLAPGDPQLALQLAMALHSARDNKAVLEILDGLMKIGADAAPLNFMYGDTLLELARVDQAIPYLEKAVRGEPGNLHARAALGIAYARAGRMDAALPHLKAGAAVDRDGRVHFQLARAFRAAGDAEAARLAMEKYQELQKQQQPADPAITPP